MAYSQQIPTESETTKHPKETGFWLSDSTQ